MVNRIGPWERVVSVRFGGDVLSVLRRADRKWDEFYDLEGQLTQASYSYFADDKAHTWQRSGAVWQRQQVVAEDAVHTGVSIDYGHPAFGLNDTRESLSGHWVWVVYNGRLYRYESNGLRQLDNQNTAPAAGVRSFYDDYPLATHHPALNPVVAGMGEGSRNLNLLAPAGLESWVSTELLITDLTGKVGTSPPFFFALSSDLPLINYAALSERIFTWQAVVGSDPIQSYTATAANNYAQGWPELPPASSTDYWSGLPPPFVPGPGAPPATYSASLGPSSEDVGVQLRNILIAEFDALAATTELPA